RVGEGHRRDTNCAERKKALEGCAGLRVRIKAPPAPLHPALSPRGVPRGRRATAWAPEGDAHSSGSFASLRCPPPPPQRHERRRENAPAPTRDNYFLRTSFI